MTGARTAATKPRLGHDSAGIGLTAAPGSSRRRAPLWSAPIRRGSNMCRRDADSQVGGSFNRSTSIWSSSKGACTSGTSTISSGSPPIVYTSSPISRLRTPSAVPWPVRALRPLAALTERRAHWRRRTVTGGYREVPLPKRHALRDFARAVGCATLALPRACLRRDWTIRERAPNEISPPKALRIWELALGAANCSRRA